jgi:hypothetical protein
MRLLISNVFARRGMFLSQERDLMWRTRADGINLTRIHSGASIERESIQVHRVCFRLTKKIVLTEQNMEKQVSIDKQFFDHFIKQWSDKVHSDFDESWICDGRDT